jgi:hypothetical protein
MHIILAGALFGGLVLIHWVLKSLYESEKEPVHRSVRK